MKSLPWQAKLGILLVSCSALVYLTKLSVIDNLPGTIEYIFNSFGFLFINVLLVTLVINELLSRRARNARLEKLNMVIGIFFTEVGVEFLRRCIPTDPEKEVLISSFQLTGKESPDKKKMFQAVSNHPFTIRSDEVDFGAFQELLEEKRNFLLRLMENPVMLEHQTFTSLLQAVFHLTAELGHRKDPDNLSAPDKTHLAGDISRVYRALTSEWIQYMGYLYNNYPYLYSLAVRTNPFDQGASIEISE